MDKAIFKRDKSAVRLFYDIYGFEDRSISSKAFRVRCGSSDVRRERRSRCTYCSRISHFDARCVAMHPPLLPVLIRSNFSFSLWIYI